MEAGVDMEDGVENEGCRAVGPDSDLTTPLLRFVVEAGIEKPDTDTAGAAVVVPIRVGTLRSGLFFMFFRDSSRGFEMLEDGAVGAAVVVVIEGAEVRVRGAVLAALGAVMVRSIVGAGVVVVAGVVSGTGMEREIRLGAELTAGAVPDEEVGAGDENRVKEGARAGVGSEAGGGISGSGSSRTFCIWLRAAFFSISRSFTVIV